MRNNELTYLLVHYLINNPNGPSDPRVDKQFFDYDANGNITHIEREVNDPDMPMDTTRESVRKFVWDEEDRLLGVDLRPESPAHQPHIAAYTYDANGERGIRYVPKQSEGVYSGSTAGYVQDLDIMLYPNALITVRPQEFPERFDPMRLPPNYSYTTYTKHYYIGSERINSKLGTLNSLGVLCEQMAGNDLVNEMNTRVDDAGKRMNILYDFLAKKLDLDSPYAYSPNHRLVCNYKSHNPKLYDAYWYHPDHLGSSSFITNTTGEISQHMEYLPFGETLVEEHLNSYNSPFKFNAKEFDAETGNYYYGARYYDPKWSTLLTPDPALESYPGISPYAYTLNNPVRYVDPTGMFVESPEHIIINYIDNEGEKRQHTYQYGNTYKGSNQYVKDAYDALNYIIDNDADKESIIKSLANDTENNVNIFENTKENNRNINHPLFQSFFLTEGLNTSKAEIIWDSRKGSSFTNTKGFISWIMGKGYSEDGQVSAAEVLLHELGHSFNYFGDPNKHKRDSNSYLSGYGSKEEFNVIRNIENPASRALGRKVIRKGHYGSFYQTISPTSITPIKK